MKALRFLSSIGKKALSFGGRALSKGLSIGKQLANNINRGSMIAQAGLKAADMASGGKISDSKVGNKIMTGVDKVSGASGRASNILGLI